MVTGAELFVKGAVVAGALLAAGARAKDTGDDALPQIGFIAVVFCVILW